MLSYSNICNFCNTDIVEFTKNLCETLSDHIFDFTWSGYKIIPNMWSELAEVTVRPGRLTAAMVDGEHRPVKRPLIDAGYVQDAKNHH